MHFDAYYTLFSGTGIHHWNEGNSISREAYANGYSLFALDLSASHLIYQQIKTHIGI